jgi:hypothetical protein
MGTANTLNTRRRAEAEAGGSRQERVVNGGQDFEIEQDEVVDLRAAILAV